MPRLPSSILDRNRFKRQADRCHSLSTSHKPVLSPLCFHGLTNCFSRKPFAFINICVAPRVSPPTVHAIQEFTSGTNQLFNRHAYELLVAAKTIICIGISNFRTPSQKHPGWGRV